LGALPARFRRPRVLVVGCGDVGTRALGALTVGARVWVLTSSAQRVVALRQRGVTPLIGNLDQPATLARLAGIAQRVLHLAPPPSDNATQDSRTRALVHALRRRTPANVWVYGSTSGVYGDCGGEWVDETRAVRPGTARALRRVDAETVLRQMGRVGGSIGLGPGAGAAGHCRVNVLRIPGIYAPDRVDGMPLARLRAATPVLAASDDVFTNHIHADDLARACVAALWRGRAQRAYNVNDDSDLRMGDYFDVAADLFGLPRPPRLSREAASKVLSPLRMSFMGESRRMDNRRMKQELRVTLRFPTVRTGLLG
jgi:nucleoside-diphosphate-sugar epimerase